MEEAALFQWGGFEEHVTFLACVTYSFTSLGG